MKTILYLSVVALLAGAISACNNPAKRTETADDPVVHHDGVQIAYIDTGSKDTTLLFVHGWGINKSYWADQIKEYSPKYRVVAMDMAGFGESGKNRDTWTTKDFAGDVDSVIKQLNLKNVILIGHSMAGDVVLQSAIDNPDRVIGLVGIDNFDGPGTPVSAKDKKDYEMALAEMRKHFKSVVTQWFNAQLFYKTTSKEVRNRVMADVYKADSVIAIASLEDTTFKELPKLQQAKKKLYVLHSDVRPVNTKYLEAAKVPFKILYVKETGHYPMIEKPKEFNELLDKILEDIKSTSPAAP